MNQGQFSVKGSIYRPVKGEDVFFVKKCQGEVSSFAVVIDGATGMKKRILPNGEEITLDNIVTGKKTSARVWADLLSQKISKIASDSKKDLIDIVQEATKQATKDFPDVAGSVFPQQLDPLQVPSAAILITRIRNGNFEVFSNGDCGMLIRYQDGHLETYTGNKVLDDMREQRDAQIMREHPNFKELSNVEQGKIRYSYMQKTKENWGKKYFTPYLGGADNMDNFKNVTDFQKDAHKEITTYANGMMWYLTTKATNIREIAMFSDGADPAFMNSEVAKYIMFEENPKTAMKKLAILARVGASLKTNEHAAAVQSVNKGNSADVKQTKRKKSVFDDMTAWLLHVNQDAQIK